MRVLHNEDENLEYKLTDISKIVNRDKRVGKFILNVIKPQIKVPNDTQKVRTVLQAGMPVVYLTHIEVTEARLRDSSLTKKQARS